MLEKLVPAACSKFALSHNRQRCTGIGLSAFIRSNGLGSAFHSRADLKQSIATGELWVMETDRPHASSSFAGLLRIADPHADVPSMLDAVTPELPRHDCGLSLVYDCDASMPWSLEWRAESRSDRRRIRAVTLQALLQGAFDLERDRLIATAARFAQNMAGANATTLVH